MQTNMNITLVGPKSNISPIDSIGMELPIEIIKIKTIEELFPLLSDPTFSTDIIAIDIEHFHDKRGVEIFDIINTLKTLINCTVYRVSNTTRPIKRNIKIMGIAGDDTDISLIKDAEKIVDKILIREGNTFSHKDFKEDLEYVIEGKYKNHKKIQEMLKSNKKKIQQNTDLIKLTPRQEQILNIVKNRGASNKIIAKILNISESTVKLHISSILKKYGVKNRTQLVLFSKN